MKKILTVLLISLLMVGLIGKTYAETETIKGLAEEITAVYEKYGQYEATPVQLTDALFRLYLEAALLKELNKTSIRLYEHLSSSNESAKEKLIEAKKNAPILRALSKDLYRLSEKYYSAFSSEIPKNLASLYAEIVLVKKLAKDLAVLSNKYKGIAFIKGFDRCFQEMSLIFEEFAKELTEIYNRHNF